MPDLRTEKRVKENHPINWTTESGEQKGKARIRNISSSGMTLETESAININGDSTLIFDSGLGFENFVPNEGKVIWRKNKNGLSDRQLLGIKFTEPKGQAGEYLATRITKREKQQKIVGWLKRGLAALCVVLSLGLIIYTSWLFFDVQSDIQETNTSLSLMVEKQSALTRNFSNLYVEFRNLYKTTKTQLDAATEELKTTKQLYAESQQMLQQVTSELDSTRSILSKTQNMINGMLKEMGIESDATQLDESQMVNKQSEFETAVNTLQERNERLGEELNLIKQQLMYYAGEVKDVDQAKKWFAMYRDRVKKVKQRIKVFRQQTQEIKVSAQSQLDQIQSNMGNNGYMTKNGQAIHVDIEQYNSVTLEQVIKQQTAPVTAETTEPKKVEIDVNFFK